MTQMKIITSLFGWGKELPKYVLSLRIISEGKESLW